MIDPCVDVESGEPCIGELRPAFPPVSEQVRPFLRAPPRSNSCAATASKCFVGGVVKQECRQNPAIQSSAQV